VLESLNITSADNSSEDPRFESVRNQITKWLLAEQWKLRELSNDKTVWTIEEIVNLLDQKEQLVIQAGALQRGSYKKRANVKNSH